MTAEASFGFTCGFSIKFCLRYSACLGTILSMFFISVGTIILLRTLPWRNTGESEGSFYIYDRYMIYYSGNDQILLPLALSLLVINIIQIFADAGLLVESFRELGEGRRPWLNCLFIMDVLLWSLNLMSLVIILSGSGFLLLIFFLVGTCIRTYILAIIYQLIAQFKKLSNFEAPQKDAANDAAQASVCVALP